MPTFTETILSQVVSVFFGGAVTGFCWLAKALLKARTDLDIAHTKIRILELQIENIEKFCKDLK